MSDAIQAARPTTPAVKGIVSERESQLRLVTSVRLRWAAVLGQLIAIAVTMGVYGFPMEVGSCLVLVAMSAWLNVYLSIRYPARHRLSTDFATALLAYDALQLTGLLYFTGGIQNPFAMLLAAPVTVAASTLPPRYATLLGTLVLACAIFLSSSTIRCLGIRAYAWNCRAITSSALWQHSCRPHASWLSTRGG